MCTDLEILLRTSPMTPSLRALAERVDYYNTINRGPRTGIRASLLGEQVVASNDPWTEVQYQSLYIGDDLKDRVVLQEPPVDDATVGVMVLKASRLQGQSGMVYCGTPEQLKSFAGKLAAYEERGQDLSEKDFLDCLRQAAESEGLKINYLRLSQEHGGEDYDEELD
jgi:hypothetical protein